MNSLSVIIPCLNEEQEIAGAIKSAQNAGADEIIVVDGGSSDQTVAIAKQLTTVNVVTPSGRSRQQNHGAAIAGGDILLFLHADCRLPENIAFDLKQRLSTPNVVGGCFRQQIDGDQLKFRLVEAGNSWRVRLLKWAYGDQAIFVRRDVFDALNGFPDLQFMEDLYFVKRLKSHGKLILLNGPLIVSARRWQSRGLINQTLLNWLLISAAHLGVSPDRLARYYKNDR